MANEPKKIEEFNIKKGVQIGTIRKELEPIIHHYTQMTKGEPINFFDERYMIPHSFSRVVIWVPRHFSFHCVRCGRCCIGMIKPVPLRKQEAEILEAKKVGFCDPLEGGPVNIDGRMFDRRCRFLRMDGDTATCTRYSDRPDPCRVYPVMLQHEETRIRKEADHRAKIVATMGFDAYEGGNGVCLGWSIGDQNRDDLRPMVRGIIREWEYYEKTGINRTMYHYKPRKMKKAKITRDGIKTDEEA